MIRIRAIERLTGPFATRAATWTVTGLITGRQRGAVYVAIRPDGVGEIAPDPKEPFICHVAVSPGGAM
jgi:hypothetical protein